jgi:hypothetical protein
MEHLGGRLRGELERLAPADADMVELVRAWPAAVGEAVARNAWPARLQRDGTLVVHAVSSTWAYELGRMAAEVLERLRREAGPATPPALRFVPGPIPEPEAPAAERRAASAPPVAAEDVADAATAAAAIADPGLRELVARAAAASLARARAGAGSDRGF